MAGSVLEPKEILEYSAHKGTAKAENSADRLGAVYNSLIAAARP